MAGPTLPPQRIKFAPVVHHGTLKDCKFSILLQGEPGSGKTRFMSTMPSPLFLVWDTNLGTHDQMGLRYVLVRGWEGDGEEWLEVIRKRRVSEVVGFKVETLCLDTLSGFGGQMTVEMADGHAKLGTRDKWDEYYARLNKFLRACVEATKPDNAHPERETYWTVAGLHEEPVYETTLVAGQERRVLSRVKPTLSGRMANANEIYSHFSAHFLCERVVSTGPDGKKADGWQIRTKPTGVKYCMPSKVGKKPLPEVMPNDWAVVKKEWGLEE
jgi:hypothetical protein